MLYKQIELSSSSLVFSSSPQSPPILIALDLVRFSHIPPLLAIELVSQGLPDLILGLPEPNTLTDIW